MTAPLTASPWYRQPLVWLIIAIPLSAVIMSSITIVLAVVSNDGTVADDYYRRGLEINRSLQRDRMAAMLDLNATLIAEPNEQRVRVRMQAKDGFEFPNRLLLQLSHATQQGFDQDLILHNTGARLYEAALGDVPNGRWYVTLSDAGWRLNGVLNFPTKPEVLLLHDPNLRTEETAGNASVL